MHLQTQIHREWFKLCRYNVFSFFCLRFLVCYCLVLLLLLFNSGIFFEILFFTVQMGSKTWLQRNTERRRRYVNIFGVTFATYKIPYKMYGNLKIVVCHCIDKHQIGRNKPKRNVDG